MLQVSSPLETEIIDREDGTYYIKFRPPAPGKYVLLFLVYISKIYFNIFKIHVYVDVGFIHHNLSKVILMVI